MKRIITLLMALCVSSSVFGLGLEPLPDESGLDGYINIGASWLKVKSNSFSGSSRKTVTSDRSDGIYSSPNSEDSVSPLFGGEFRYTFAESQTQVFLGNGLMDWIRFDRADAAGIRHELEDGSIVEGSFLFNMFSTEVWSDPFLTGAHRAETKRSSMGGRVAWGRMFGTSLQISYSYRDIDIDNESSGASLGLTPLQRRQLDRNGDHHRAEVMYIFPINDHNWIAPTLRYNRYELDGDAMSHDRWGLQVTHIYACKKWRLISNLFYAMADYDTVHPVYSQTRDDRQYGVSTALFVPNFMNRENLTGNIGIGYWFQDSNIAFYEDEILAISAGTMYAF